MTDRILDFTDAAARLSVRDAQLVIRVGGEPDRTAPLCDIAALIVGNVGVTYTNAVLEGLSRHGGLLVVCDGRHSPAAMMLPLNGHSLQTSRFVKQALAPPPVKKRLWQALVRAKLRNQGRLLHQLRGNDAGLTELAATVRSGDPGNFEAQGARRYWQKLFGGEEGFRRDPKGGGANSLLNYGYGVLRAMVARAVCASGLHPSLGVHHHNQYNPFCLADDLMEPFRPLVDEAVVFLVAEHGPRMEMSREIKARLLAPMLGRVVLANERRTLFDGLARMTASLAAVFEQQAGELLIPEVVFHTEPES